MTQTKPPLDQTPNHQFDSEDLTQCQELWGKLAATEGRWGRDWSMAALAAAQRTEISLSAFADTMYNHVQVCVCCVVLCAVVCLWVA